MRVLHSVIGHLQNVVQVLLLVLNRSVVNPGPQNSSVFPDVGVELVDEDLVRHDNTRLGDVHARLVHVHAWGEFVEDLAVAGLDVLIIVAIETEVEVAVRLHQILQVIVSHALRVTLRRVGL